MVRGQERLQQRAQALTKAILQLRKLKRKLLPAQNLTRAELKSLDKLIGRQRQAAIDFSHQLTFLVFYTFCEVYRNYTGPVYLPNQYDFRARFYY